MDKIAYYYHMYYLCVVNKCRVPDLDSGSGHSRGYPEFAISR